MDTDKGRKCILINGKLIPYLSTTASQILQPSTQILQPSMGASIQTAPALLVESDEAQTKVDFKWNSNQTKQLLDLYSIYIKKVGTLQVKSQKRMWQIIAEKLKNEMQIDVSDQNCQNRWRVLERSYKKYIDNQNSTGSERKFFEFTEEMEKIFGGNKSVRPELIFSNEETHTMETEMYTSNIENVPDNETVRGDKEKSQPPEKFTLKAKGKLIKSKQSCLQGMREDRKKYYNERVQIEREKLEELRRKNKLIEERNKIMAMNNNCNGN